MKNSIVPLTWSAGFDQALKFAVEFARKSEAKIILYNLSLIYETNGSEEGNTALHTPAGKLQAIAKEVATYGSDSGRHLACDFRMDLGLPGAGITAVCEKYSPELIVMETRGAETIFSALAVQVSM